MTPTTGRWLDNGGASQFFPLHRLPNALGRYARINTSDTDADEHDSESGHPGQNGNGNGFAVTSPLEQKSSGRSVRRLTVLAIGVAAISVSLLAVFLVSGWRSAPVLMETASYTTETDEYSPAKYLRGPPTANFSDNLRDDMQYITAFANSGFSNQVMAFADMLLVALFSERIPILPPFDSGHLRTSDGMHFGDVFDVPVLARAVRMPVLEWRDVKHVNLVWEEAKRPDSGEPREPMGCWSAWMAGGGSWPSWAKSMQYINADISFTPAPASFRLREDYPDISLVKMSTLGFPVPRQQALGQGAQPLPSSEGHLTLEPDAHLLCFDLLYYSAVADFGEWETAWSMQWRLAGVHMRWTDKLTEVTTHLLREAFGAWDKAPLSPFIAVHIRRGDFKDLDFCHGDAACLPSTDRSAELVTRVQARLADEQGVAASRVLVTSDEADPAWWAEVRARGWFRLDHAGMRTEEAYGAWYPMLVDSVALSMGAGFVGTASSTFSVLAAYRVESWNGGPTELLVPW